MAKDVVDPSQSGTHLKPSNIVFGESLEIILADKHGCKIQATFNKNYLNSLENECKKYTFGVLGSILICLA
ncbi:hypothetical protein YC2023_030702 [Brassica napus]